MGFFSNPFKSVTNAVKDVGSFVDDVAFQPVKDVVEGGVDLAKNTVDTTLNMGESLLKGDVSGAFDELRSGVNKIDDIISETYMDIRDPLEAAAVVAGNYFFPGSSIITSKLVSDDAQEILASNGGQLANLAAGAAGAYNTYNAPADVGGVTGPDNIDVGGGFNPAAPSAATTSETLAAQTEKMLAPVVDSSAPIPGEAAKLEQMANATSDPIAAMNAAKGYTTSDTSYLKGIGAPENVIANAPTTSAEVIGAATPAVPATSSLTEKALATKGAIDTVVDKLPKQPDGQQPDYSAAINELIAMLMQRRKESLANSYSQPKEFYAGGAATATDITVDGTTAKYALANSEDITNQAPADLALSVAGKTEATAATTDTTAAGLAATATKAADVTDVTRSQDVVATQVTAPASVTADTITASTAETNVAKSLEKLQAEQGVLSEASKIVAQTMEPTSTAVGNLQAAQGTAAQIGAVADRTLQAGELITGTGVDQAKIDAALKQNVAAQGTVTSEMTAQGQLNKILTDFNAGNPPPWASASMRAATAQLAARGLGASSLAGQAVIQAALEAATPIAAADAKVYEQMGLTNLSNRQAMALTTAEQRAKFLGQEFDQTFQTKVLNAAKISDIADKNFTADVQIAIENAQLANSMNIANLSAKNALILAEAAQIANLETSNLNNRQQAAVENAKSFLAMDIKNLDNKQQTALFKAKEIADVIVSDTAAENAAKATNAANKLDADKINANLALTASTFNAQEKNKVAISNQTAADAMLKFNAQEKNDRAEFNANLATQVSMANAKILADISMANTKEKNAIASINAKNATDMAVTVYTQKTQTYRDQLELAYKKSDDNADRANEIMKQVIVSNASKYTADKNADAAFYNAIGSALTKMATGSGGVTGLINDFKSAWRTVSDLI
jgi:hypothetical protein